MANNGETVPSGYWFCGLCHQPNQIPLAPDKCSNCGHTRDGCCSEEGDPRPPPTSRYTANPSSIDLLGSHPSINQHEYSDFQHTMYNYPFNSLGPAGSPAAGSWICECGASNSNLTPNFCPVCGRKY